jgi:hypothetical protein
LIIAIIPGAIIYNNTVCVGKSLEQQQCHGMSSNATAFSQYFYDNHGKGMHMSGAPPRKAAGSALSVCVGHR